MSVIGIDLTTISAHSVIDTSTSNSPNTPSGPASVTQGQTPTVTLVVQAKSKTGAITGGALGGIIGIAFLFGMLYYVCSRGLRRRQLQMDVSEIPETQSAAAFGGNYDPKPNTLEDGTDYAEKWEQPTVVSAT
jgi:hypothetical protein